MKFAKVKSFKNMRKRNILKKFKLNEYFFNLSLSEPLYSKTNRRLIKEYNKLKKTWDLSVTENKVLDDLNAYGICVSHISDFMDFEIVDKFNVRFNNLINDCGENIMTDISSSNKNLCINGNLSNCQIRKDLIFNDSINKIACSYLEQLARFGHCEEVVSIPTGNRKGSANWHRDGSDIKIFKAFLYISDVNHENGPFEFVKKSHHKGILGHVYNLNACGMSKRPSGKTRWEPVVDEIEELSPGLKYTAVGKAGTIVFADTSGLHRGGFCKDKQRRVISLGWYSDALFTSVPPYKIETNHAHELPDYQRIIFGLD